MTNRICVDLYFPQRIAFLVHKLSGDVYPVGDIWYWGTVKFAGSQIWEVFLLSSDFCCLENFCSLENLSLTLSTRQLFCKKFPSYVMTLSASRLIPISSSTQIRGVVGIYRRILSTIFFSFSISWSSTEVDRQLPWNRSEPTSLNGLCYSNICVLGRTHFNKISKFLHKKLYLKWIELSFWWAPRPYLINGGLFKFLICSVYLIGNRLLEILLLARNTLGNAFAKVEPSTT